MLVTWGFCMGYTGGCRQISLATDIGMLARWPSRHTRSSVTIRCVRGACGTYLDSTGNLIAEATWVVARTPAVAFEGLLVEAAMSPGDAMGVTPGRILAGSRFEDEKSCRCVWRDGLLAYCATVHVLSRSFIRPRGDQHPAALTQAASGAG